MSTFLEALKQSQTSGKSVVEEFLRLKEAKTDSSDFCSTITIQRSDASKRQIFGWAYQTRTPSGDVIIDLNRGFTDTDILEEGAYDFVLVCRSMGEMHEKEEDGSKFVMRGRLIESMMFTRDKCDALGIPQGLLPEGWWVGFYVDDDATWDAIERGELKDLSVAGIAHSTYMEP